MRFVAGLLGVLAWSLSSTAAPAQVSSETAAPATDEALFKGMGMAINFRDIAAMGTLDFTASGSQGRSAVEASRFSAGTVILPAALESTTLWAAWVGVKTGVFRFEKAADPSDPTQGGLTASNVEPTFGYVLESPGDRLRFELDGALALSVVDTSLLAAQAALVAATSIAPHDDLLFVPNLRGAGRLRVALTRRWYFTTALAADLGVEIETGLAKTQGLYGMSSGVTGGGALVARFYVRPWHVVPYASGDVSYTSVWAQDVALPLRVCAGIEIPFTRNIQAFAEGAAFTTNAINGFNSWAVTLGVSVGYGRTDNTWARRSLDLAPDLDLR